MLRQTNISEALLYFGMANNFCKLLLYAILKFFDVVFEQSYHNIEQYKLVQQDSIKKHFTSGEHSFGIFKWFKVKVVLLNVEHLGLKHNE